MINQLVLVGNLTTKPKIKNNKTIITIAIPRNLENKNHEKDYIDVVLLSELSKAICDYCNIGDLIGVKGRIKTTINKEQKKKKTEIIAEKITLLKRKENINE